MRYLVCAVSPQALSCVCFAFQVPALWATAIIAELLIYPLAALKAVNRVPVNIWHVMERQMLWVILILGESLISLILPVLPCECDVSQEQQLGTTVLYPHSLMVGGGLCRHRIELHPGLQHLQVLHQRATGLGGR